MTNYDDLQKLKQRLEEKAQSLARQAAEVEHQLKSVTTTLELLGYSSSTNGTQEDFIYPPAQVKGLTHHQALERIAKANGGHFKLKDAVRVLVAGRLISNPKNGYNILFNTMKRIGKFKKTGNPGEYVLPNREEERPLLAEVAHR